MLPWSYSRCAECNNNRQVFPSGPITASIMLIGEGPGGNEDREGVPFVGVGGREQDHTYFGLAGLDRRDVFVTNCVQCRCERGGADVRPGDKLLSVCAANHLQEEIWTVNPEIIILAGATACYLVNADLEFEHGFPFRYSGDRLFGWEGWIVPMYHPVAGLRETRFMILLLDDWARFGRWLRHEWEPPKPANENLDYRLIERPEELERYEFGDEVGVDTESDEGTPYSIQCSPSPGVAFMARVQDRAVVRRIDALLSNRTLILHNALYDLSECERVGIKIRRFRDTMQEIYHLGGILPQGLKAAVYRVFGYRMTSYDDVVTLASKAKLDDWLAEALSHVIGHMRELTLHKKGKGCPACGKNHRADKTEWHAHEAEPVLRRVMGKLDSDYDPWQAPKYDKEEFKPRLLGRSWLEEIEVSVGRMPRPSIIHAPLERQVMYACGDADWTGRLATWLAKERQRIVQQEWRVA